MKWPRHVNRANTLQHSVASKFVASPALNPSIYYVGKKEDHFRRLLWPELVRGLAWRPSSTYGYDRQITCAPKAGLLDLIESHPPPQTVPAAGMDQSAALLDGVGQNRVEQR